MKNESDFYVSILAEKMSYLGGRLINNAKVFKTFMKFFWCFDFIRKDTERK